GADVDGLVADRARAVLAEVGDRLGHARPWRALGQPAVAPLGRPTQRRLRGAADPDREPGLPRTGPHARVVDVLAREGGAYLVDGIVGEASPSREVDAEQRELGLDVTGAHTQDRPPARELVEGHERLRR